MTAGDEALVREIYAAISAGDFQRVSELAVEDFVVDLSLSLAPYRGVYRGREEAERAFVGYREAWARVTWELEELTAVRPGVLVAAVCVRARGSDSDIELEARGGHLWEIEAGRAKLWRLYQSADEALAAARSPGE